ncbi:MAG TPA: efflux RND transporter periplasmic adaptor subunit [Woeseiaceae bacterium]
MRRNRFGVLAIIGLFVITGCKQGGEQAAKEEEDAPPVPVETSQPIRGDVFAVYTGTAPVEAFAEADVIGKVEGEVRSILVEEGDVVSKGQVLARLDGERLKLELSESEARLRKMQRDFQRNKDLREKGLLSEGDFEKLQYDLEALEASYNLAKLELDYTQIRAPIDGVVSERYIRLGNMIASGTPTFRVTSFDPLVAYLHIPEREYRQISPGQPVSIQIDALDGNDILATVTRVSPVVDPDTGTFKMTMEIGNADRRIKPGMFGRMSIVYDRHENVLQIPRSALVEDMGESSVFVVADNKAERRPVQVGYGNNGMVEITFGLKDDDRVVTVGQIGLKPGATVSVINDPAPDADVPEDAETSTESVAEGES